MALPIVLLLLLFAFRFQLLLGLGYFLIQVDEPQKTDVIYVLGGNSKDRGEKAAELYHSGYSKEIVCIGGNWHDVLQDYGIKTLESEVTQKVVINNSVPKKHTRLIKKSTSTIEEKEAIIEDITQRKYQSITIVSDKFHSRRIRNLFEDELNDLNVSLYIIGATNSRYSEDKWWEEERGMIMVNNEYMKALYYFLKY